MQLSFNDNSPVNGTSVGALAIKNKLIELHQRMLGETLVPGDEELEASYLLLVETWQERVTSPDHSTAWTWPNENCSFYLGEHWEEDGAANTAQDANGMLNTWTTMLIYFMTDFNYLHE